MMNYDEKFLQQLTHLDPIQFIGVAKMLGIEVIKNEEPIPFEDLIEQILIAHNNLSRKRRRNLNRILRAATKEAKK